MEQKAGTQKRGSRFKPCQLRPLFNAVKARPKLMFAKFSNTFTQLDSQRLWEEVAIEVNADGSGPPKTGVKWAKVWSDQKRAIKAHQAAILRGLRATGGGPPDTIEPLSPLEEEIITYMGQTTISGDESTPVPEIRRVECSAPVAEPPLVSNQLASTSNGGDSNTSAPPQQRLEQALRPKRKASPPSVQDLPPGKRAAQDLLNYQEEILAIRHQELSLKKRRLELEERKVLALESIATSLAQGHR